MRKVFLIVNPTAGNGKTALFLPEVENRLRAEGIVYNPFFTTTDCLAEQLVREKLDESYTDLLIVGGDGTFNEAINGLSRFNLAIGLVQTGTGNDFIRAIDAKANPRTMLQAAINAEAKPIDLGICNGRKFNNGVGIGFDGGVAHRAAELKAEQKGSVASYYRAIAEGIFGYKGYEVETAFNNNSAKRPTFMITVANGIAFGGGMKVTPKAKINDGLLDVCQVERVSVLGRLWRLPFLVAGRHLSLPKVRYSQTKKLLIESEVEACAHLDGEIFRAKRFEIELATEKLMLRY